MAWLECGVLTNSDGDDDVDDDGDGDGHKQSNNRCMRS